MLQLIKYIGRFKRLNFEICTCHPHSFFSLFFLKIFDGHMSFSWGHRHPCFKLLVMSPFSFKARMGSLIRTWCRCMCTCSLRFTSGATPADLLEGSMVAEPISFMYLPAGIDGAKTWNLLCCR